MSGCMCVCGVEDVVFDPTRELHYTWIGGKVNKTTVCTVPNR